MATPAVHAAPSFRNMESIGKMPAIGIFSPINIDVIYMIHKFAFWMVIVIIHYGIPQNDTLLWVFNLDPTQLVATILQF